MSSTGAGFEFEPFSRKQLKLLYWWAEGSPYKDKDILIADGSIRSGKTVACICSFLMFVFLHFTNENFIIAGKTIGALKRNVIKPMLQILEAWGIGYTYNRSGNYIQVAGHTFYLFGANNEASQDSLQGLTAAGAYVDEAALFPQSFTEQMLGRCSVMGSKVFLNCNPASPNHYIKREYIDKADAKNICRLHFTLEDNLTLDPSTVERYHRMYTGVFYERFIRGLWVSAEGLVYKEFADNVSSYTVDDDYIATQDIAFATIGVDFGGNKSAHSFTLTGFTRGLGEVITLDEWYSDGRLTPEELSNRFCDFVRRAKERYNVYEAYCDSAEQVLIKGFEVAAARRGLAMEIKNAIKGAINDRIAFYNSLIASRRWHVHESCKRTIEAFCNAVYDDKAKTGDVRLDDGSSNIDSIDSQEYSTERYANDVLEVIRGGQVEQDRAVSTEAGADCSRYIG